MLEIYTMDENGVTLVDTPSYSEWMAFVASPNEVYIASDKSEYSKDSLTAVVK